MNHLIREKRIYCGNNYLEVDIFPCATKAKNRKRNKKAKESLPKQKSLNEKNARRKLIQLVEANFTSEDLVVHLTYDNKYLPHDIETAEKEVINFLRRMKRKRKTKGLGELRYILVTSHGINKETGEVVRLHHHLLMNGGLERDEVENLWRKAKKKGEKQGEKIGYANADRLQPNYNTGLTELAVYLSKNPTQRKRWSCSKNLKRPESRTNDYKYSRNLVQKLATKGLDIAYWERKYKGYTIKDKLTGFRAEYNEITGWSLYIKLRKIE